MESNGYWHHYENQNMKNKLIAIYLIFICQFASLSSCKAQLVA